jgi:hypothetical protein
MGTVFKELMRRFNEVLDEIPGVDVQQGIDIESFRMQQTSSSRMDLERARGSCCG